jgi:membrane fusion protein, multidrug efflux system
LTRRGVITLAAVALAAALVGAWALRGGAARAKAPAAAASAPVRPIELAAGDTAVVARRELVSLLVVSGGLKAVDSAVVKARVAAEVKTLAVREGDRVAAGQLLGRLDTSEVDLRLRQAEDQAQAAQAQLDIAQRTLDNNRSLVGQGFISKNALDTSISSAAGAQATLQAARAAAELAKKAVRDSEIRAPIAGLVSQRLVQPGERVAVDARLLEIVDLSRIELEAAVAPEDVLNLRVGQAAQVQIDGLAAPMPARVVRINPSAQSGTRSVTAYLRLEPDAATASGLRQGLFARGSIRLQQRQALVMPVSALRLDQALPYVLVVEGGAAQARNVTAGGSGEVLIDGRSESAIEVTEGVAEGALVLRGTVGNLRPGTLVGLAAPAPAASAAR